jgi:hypothetical protein
MSSYPRDFEQSEWCFAAQQTLFGKSGRPWRPLAWNSFRRRRGGAPASDLGRHEMPAPSSKQKASSQQQVNRREG